MALGGSIRTAARAEESVTLVQLTRAQIETIQQSPFRSDPSDYPIISDIPEGFTITVTSTDPGTRYTYPAPDGSAITDVIQEIQVTSTGDFSNVTMSMYKIRMP